MQKKTLGLLTLAMAFGAQAAMAATGTMTLGEYAQLPDCGGTIKVSIVHRDNQERVQIQFKDVVNCSNFDILSANGDKVIYKSKKLSGEHMSRDGRFLIPRDLIDLGMNSVRINIKSDTGMHSDTIRVKFAELPVLPVPSVVVVTPSAGGGY